MRLEGRIWTKGRFWLVEVPILDVMTQGRSRREAVFMIKDAIESLVNDPGFSITVHTGEKKNFEIEANDTNALVALLLRRQRQKHGLSLAEVAEKLDQSSRNAYARYERGVTVPTMAKLEKLFRAVAPDIPLVLRPSHARAHIHG